MVIAFKATSLTFWIHETFQGKYKPNQTKSTNQRATAVETQQQQTNNKAG